VVDLIKRMPERNRFMKGMFAWGGFRQTSVEYDRARRGVGKTKFNYWKLWTLALDGITSTSTMPLRIWSYIGVVIAFFSLIYAVYVIVKTTLFGIDVPGYPSLMVAILFFGGLQLISLGVLGEYIGRILIEAKQRPIYVVRRKIGMPDEEG
jgi:glycosyltransferase involved in cell wall biosynthesis